jgi:prolyl 4-hydroxylase
VLSSYAITALLVASYSYGITFSPFSQLQSIISTLRSPPLFVCEQHQYTTEIVSIDPLLIYINNFVSDKEAQLLVATGFVSLPSASSSIACSKEKLSQTSKLELTKDTREPNLERSVVYLEDRKVPSKSRTSRSGALDPTSPITQCVLSRASAFLGTLLSPIDDFGTPQLVRYEQGQKFDVHHDWYDSPQRINDGSGRFFNRIASFFVYLEAEEGKVRGGETWFPHIEAKENPGKWGKRVNGMGGEVEKGAMFVPRKGNALFWVNLHANGTGDERVVHAGLPLLSGRKTAMNIWPRKIYERRRGWFT